MNLQEYRKQFKEELAPRYPDSELQAFLNLLINHVLGLNQADLILNPNRILNNKEKATFLDALARLNSQEPIQYILGHTEFFGLPMVVNEQVLIPRQETEELVAWIIEETRNDQSINILEIGTGSGCIAISLAKALPNATVWALDISEKAIELAQRNAKNNSVKINFLYQDILTNQHFEGQQFDVIVSNPPYVRDLERNEISDNVLKYEPHLALFVTDHDPLLFYKAILNVAHKHLGDSGQLFVEINQYLGEETAKLFDEGGFKSTLRKDLNENPRMISAKKSVHT